MLHLNNLFYHLHLNMLVIGLYRNLKDLYYFLKNTLNQNILNLNHLVIMSFDLDIYNYFLLIIHFEEFDLEFLILNYILGFLRVENLIYFYLIECLNLNSLYYLDPFIFIYFFLNLRIYKLFIITFVFSFFCYFFH